MKYCARRWNAALEETVSLSLCAIKRPKEKAGNWLRGWWRDTKERDGVTRYVEEGTTGFDHW